MAREDADVCGEGDGATVAEGMLGGEAAAERGTAGVNGATWSDDLFAEARARHAEEHMANSKSLCVFNDPSLGRAAYPVGRGAPTVMPSHRLLTSPVLEMRSARDKHEIGSRSPDPLGVLCARWRSESRGSSAGGIRMRPNRTHRPCIDGVSHT
jgi:hypothetical protein